jgi:hypothetical protein
VKRTSTVAVLLVCAGLVLAEGGGLPQSNAALEDYSGMYTFLREGEFVQINLAGQGKITGFISRYGDLDSDRGAFLDHFIKQGSLNGHKLSFNTETVHGIWFEFKGVAERGEGKTSNDDGYYVLKGTLTEHSGDAKQSTSARSREVVFKSFPEDIGAEPTKQKD